MFLKGKRKTDREGPRDGEIKKHKYSFISDDRFVNVCQKTSRVPLCCESINTKKKSETTCFHLGRGKKKKGKVENEVAQDVVRVQQTVQSCCFFMFSKSLTYTSFMLCQEVA